jgi:hypothetical protein
MIGVILVILYWSSLTSLFIVILSFKGVIVDKETKYQISLLDMQIGGLELKLALSHHLADWEKAKIRGEINDLRDKRLALKGAFRLS